MWVRVHEWVWVVRWGLESLGECGAREEADRELICRAMWPSALPKLNRGVYDGEWVSG